MGTNGRQHQRRTVRQRAAAKADAREEGVPDLRTKSVARELLDWFTPLPGPRRGARPNKGKKSRLKYTPPPWRGGAE